jgi:two-component system phosphate regulon response regulator OmpR
MTTAPSIVIVDDEEFQRQVLAQLLTRNGLRPTAALATGGELKRLAEHGLPDLVLLDVNLGEAENGFDLARWLRARSTRIGIIMVSAAGDTVDRVVGLESGADDYVTKPFEPIELLARVRAHLRRAHEAAPPPSRQTQMRVGTALLDLERHVLILASGAEDELAASEFDLLKLFVENPNRTLARDWLLEATAHREAEAYDRAIDNRIMRLRRKIEADPAKPQAIRSVRGVGYRFVPPAD